MQLRNVIKTKGNFLIYCGLVLQSIQRTDQLLRSEADSDWLWLRVGEFGTPVSSPAPGHRFALPEKRNLRLVTVCELFASGELLKKSAAEAGLQLKGNAQLS